MAFPNNFIWGAAAASYQIVSKDLVSGPNCGLISANRGRWGNGHGWSGTATSSGTAHPP
jgi:hypothetical protein